MVELALIKWRALGVTQRDRLALALDARDVRGGLRQLQIDHARLPACVDALEHDLFRKPESTFRDHA
jgi:hypothetical protein